MRHLSTSRRTCRRSKSKNACGSTPDGAPRCCRCGGVVRRGTSPARPQHLSAIGAGLQFVIKPMERMNVNLEYAQGIEDNRGVYLKLGYAW